MWKNTRNKVNKKSTNNASKLNLNMKYKKTLPKCLQEVCRENVLNGLYSKRKVRLEGISKQNLKIYDRINSQKSNYSSKKYQNKSYSNRSARSSRVSSCQSRSKNRSPSISKCISKQNNIKSAVSINSININSISNNQISHCLDMFIAKQPSKKKTLISQSIVKNPVIKEEKHPKKVNRYLQTCVRKNKAQAQKTSLKQSKEQRLGLGVKNIFLSRKFV